MQLSTELAVCRQAVIEIEGHQQPTRGEHQLSAAQLAREVTKYGELAQVCGLTCHQHDGLNLHASVGFELFSRHLCNLIWHLLLHHAHLQHCGVTRPSVACPMQGCCRSCACQNNDR